MNEPGGRPLVAQPYVWYQQLGHDPAAMAKAAPDILFQVAEAGYRQIEWWLAWVHEPDAAARIARAFSRAGLTCPSLYDDGLYHEAEAARTTLERQVAWCRTAHEHLGVTLLVTDPRPAQGRTKRDDELHEQARRLDELAAQLDAFGMKVAIHNHLPHGADQARELRAMAADAQVGFALDVEWLQAAGVAPAPLIAELGPRVAELHLRDAKGGVWLETLGQNGGELDFAAIAIALSGAPEAALVVELACAQATVISRSIGANLARAGAFVRRVF